MSSENNKSTYFEKSINYMDIESLAFMLSETNSCPFPKLLCYDCEFYKRTKSEDLIIGDTCCNFPEDANEVIKLLESEVE